MSSTLDLEIKELAKKATAEAKESKGFTFWDVTDAGLIRLRREYERTIEDNPGRPHAKIDAWLASIRWVRLVRWCLHMRYGAIDDHLGTHSFDRYYRFDEPPSYTLARDLDFKRWELRNRINLRGTRKNIIDWGRFGQGGDQP